MILHDAEVRQESLPAPAIRPYPQHYAKKATLPDGTRLLLRPIRPEDEPLMVRFHETLSDQSVYYRYFTAMSIKQRTHHARLARLCFIDYDRELALVALRKDKATSRSEIIGVARLCRAHGKNDAEFAIVISDCWRHHGLGTLLMRRLIETGWEEGLSRIHGTVLAENVGMRRLCERLGFQVCRRPGEQEFEVTITP